MIILENIKKTITFKISSLIPLLILSGCCSLVSKNNLVFTPDQLPNAVIGKPYNIRITHSGAHIASLGVLGQKPYYEVTHLKNGLTINTNIPNTNGLIEISGLPINTGTETFIIEGSTSGTQCPGIQFSKTYTITTVANEQEAKTSNIALHNNNLITACR